MADTTGQNPGHPGITWADFLSALVDHHDTLTAVAWRLVEHADGDDVASVERALRRLRTRGQKDGGVWGQRLLRVFGVPASIEQRVRWMGVYHSPFNDLPVALCLDQLRLWDRPPVSESRARVWVQLGHVTHALRSGDIAQATLHARRVRDTLGALPADYDAARIEHALVEGFIASHDGSGNPAVDAALDRAERLLAAATLADEDRDCFRARLVDQRAYQKNRAGDHATALALYESLPAIDRHPFASYRRDAGLAYGYHKLGRTQEATAIAHRACEHAGDGGYTRLRVMGLLMLAWIQGADGEPARARARAIATRLGDDQLLRRVDRGKS
ncbi:MAG TPA: hypothetical protein VFQ53_05835 [Kofleriaceae bacterium]|nr:hypothetical protein [Kofleriaceae bacterium]